MKSNTFTPKQPFTMNSNINFTITLAFQSFLIDRIVKATEKQIKIKKDMNIDT